MKRFIKYSIVLLVVIITTYLMINVSKVLAIGLTQEYSADRGPYTGELYFDSLVWSSAMFCNQHGGPYFNKADTKITVSGTVGGKSVSADVTDGGTFTLRSGTHSNSTHFTNSVSNMKITASSYSGKGLLGGECSPDSGAIPGTIYATGEIHYSEGGGISASNDEVAYLLAEAGANTPGIVPKASYPNHAWWRRTEAAAAANSGAQSAFPDDPTLNDEQERKAKDAIIGDNQAQINKLNKEKEKLEKKIAKWQKIINKYETKIDGYEEIIASLNSEIADNNKAIRKKRQQIKSYQQKLDDARTQLNIRKDERNRLQAQGQNTQKVNQQISTLNSNIKSYEDAISGLNNDIAILKNENSALQSQVNRYQKLINAIQNPDVNNKKQYNSSIPRYQKYIKKAKKRISVINAEIAQLQAEITELNKQFEDRLKDRERFMKYLDSVAVRKNVDSDGYSAGNADGLIAEARLFATMHKAIKSYGKNGRNGVYQNTIKDLTNKANVQVTYDATRKRYLVGPFRFQYMEVYSSTSYGDSESGNQGNQFAGITGVPTLSVQIYKDGRNQVEDWELGEGWTFSWEGNERSNIDSLGGSIPDQYDSYPHTGEEFYILMDYKEGMHKLGGLTFDFRCLTANGTYHYSSGYIDKWSWTAGSVSFGECDYSEDHYKWNEEKKIWEFDYTEYCDYYTSATISVSKKKAGTIATQQLMRVEYAHRYFDEIKAGYGYTPDGNLGNDKGRAKFRWNIDLTTTLAGDVWVDEDSQKDKSYTIGVKEGGEKNLKNVGVTIYIYSGSRNVRKAIAHKSNGEEIKWPIYTNSAGHYEVKRLEAPGSVKNGFYVIEFEYDGQVYRQTTYLGKSNSTTTSDGETYANQGTASAYKQNPDAYSNSSMAVEQVDTRYIFDQTFGEITGTQSIKDDNSTVGQTKTTDSAGNNATDNADAKFNTIDYRGKTNKVGEDGTQVESNLNSAASPKDGGGNQKVTEGETYDRYRMTAKTYYDNTELHEMAVEKTNFRIKYPLVEEKDANGKAQDWIYVMNRFRIKNAKGKEVGRYIDNYMLHINLGLKERPKTDMSTIKDLYKVTIVVNEQKITKQYNLLGDFDSSEYKLALEKRQNEWEGKKYTKYSLGLYSTDLAYQSHQRYKNAIPEVQEMKKGTELRVFVTYVVRVYNNSDTNNVEFNEITDYYDETYTIVSKDVKSSIVDNNSKRSEQVVADAPYYRIMNTKAAAVNNLWKETKAQNLEGKVDGVDCGSITWEDTGSDNLKATLKRQKMLMSTTKSLSTIKVKPNQYAEIFTTYEVDKEGYEKMQNDLATIKDRELIIGDKENVAEISNYSTYYSTKDYNTRYYRAYRSGWVSGRVDKDSAPNNIKRSNIKDRTRYEDDTDRAIPINIKLETYERDMYGYVWEDKKETEVGGSNGASKIKVGNGYYDNGEELIPNVGITMYEVINLGRANSSENYNTNYDNYDYYYQIPQIYYNYNNTGGHAYEITGEKSGTTAVETTKPRTPQPNYYIYGFLPGDYILRFDYGTKGDGNTDIKYSTNQNAESQQSSINIVKYNGQDYENTKFLGDLSEKSGEEHLNDKYLDLTGKTKINGTDISDLKISTARDNESRRMIVDAYSRTIENDRGQILRDREAPDTNEVENEFVKSTKMYAETPIMQIEIEDPKKMKIEGQSDESQQSSDQQLRVRENGEKYEPDAKKNQAEQDESIENHKYSIKNINFGLEERAKTDIALEKYIENIQLLKADEVILNASMTEDGEIIKTDVNATGLDKIAYLPHSKASTSGLYQQGFYALSIEDDYLNDLALRIEYKIKLINNSEADYTGKLAELYKADDIINKANAYYEYRGSMTGKTGTQYNTSTIKPQIISYGRYVGRFYYENRIKTESAAYKIKYYADNNSSLEDMAISYDADKIVTTTVDQLVDYVDVDASLENDNSIANAAWSTSELEPESERVTGGYNKSLNGLIDKTAYRVVNNKLNIFDEKNREFINTTRSNIAISYNERLGKLEQIPTPDGGTENCGDKGRVEYAEPDKARSKYNSTLTKELKPKNCFPEGSDSNEYYSEIHIAVRKEATSGDEANQMRIDNLAEVLVYSNTTGRRDINSVPGNAMVISTTQEMWKAGYNSIDYWKAKAQGEGDWETVSKNWTKYPENDAWSPEYVTVIAPTGIALRTYIKNNIIPITILLLAIGVMGIAFIVKQKKIQKNDEE